MGLGPPVWGLLVWRFADPHTEGGSSWGWRRSPLAFLLSFVTGVAFGTLYQVSHAGRQAGRQAVCADSMARDMHVYVFVCDGAAEALA